MCMCMCMHIRMPAQVRPASEKRRRELSAEPGACTPPPSHRLRTPRARALAELGRARRALQPRHVGLPQATVRALRALRRARERARRRDDASHDDNRIYEQKDARENARNATATGRTKQHKQYDLRAAAANTPSRRRTTRQRQDQNLEIGLGAQWRARGVGYGAEPAHRYFRDSARGVCVRTRTGAVGFVEYVIRDSGT